MVEIIAIAVGGAIGTCLRYLTYTLTKSSLSGALIVNLVGCIFAGFFWELSKIQNLSSNKRLLIFVGLIGAFTTFSALIIDFFNLIQENKIFYAVINLLLNNILGILIFFVGISAAKFFLK